MDCSKRSKAPLSFTVFWDCSNSCPLNQWCYLTISSSAATFSFCLQSFTASRSFPVSQLLASGGQSIGASALASVLAMNIHGWFPLRLTRLISLQSKRLSRVFSSTTIQKHQFFGSQICLAFLGGSEGKESACNAGDLVRSLGWEDLVEKGMATHSSILVWRTPWTGEPGKLQSMGLQRVRHDWVTFTLTFSLLHGPALTFIHTWLLENP